MKMLLTVIVFLAVVAGAGAVFVWNGFYDISARVPHWDITFEAIEVLRDRSIIVNSQAVTETPPGDPAKGARLYHEACFHCHAAPGNSAAPFSQGLYPAPANLLSGQIQEEWKSTQLYWIVENGIKLTGMPAFEPTYDKEEIADVVAFLPLLPKISPTDYGQLTGPSHEHHGGAPSCSP